jgi:uncharacterized protein YqjF (DUF2071 family)
MIAHRNEGPVIGFQRWDRLLFLHFEVPRESLQALVPSRLELDTFEGRAFVSVTPFTVVGARLRGAPPLPGISRFHELNVRTYVRNGEDAAVWFFSLDAASPAAVAIARASLRLPYCYAGMHRSLDRGVFRYDSVRVLPAPQATFSGSWSVRGDAAPAEPGTLSHFLCERYALFSRAFASKLFRVRVRHAPWPLRAAEEVRFAETLAQADGLPPLGAPVLAQYSDGVDVEFFPPALV